MEKVITVCSGKGGVGKSTTAACLAAAIVCRGRRVLLIDADQGICSLAGVLGVDCAPLFDVCDVTARRCEFFRAVCPCPELAGLNLAIGSLARGKFCTAADLSVFCTLNKGQYDYIIIDAPAGIGAEFESAVKAADEVILVSTPDPVTIAACAKAAAEVQKLGKRSRLIINRYDKKAARGGHLPTVDEIIDALGSRLLGIIPYDPQFARHGGIGALELPEKAVSVPAYRNIAARICGKEVGLAKF